MCTADAARRDRSSRVLLGPQARLSVELWDECFASQAFLFGFAHEFTDRLKDPWNFELAFAGSDVIM
jgi:hypothetical protein